MSKWASAGPASTPSRMARRAAGGPVRQVHHFTVAGDHKAGERKRSTARSVRQKEIEAAEAFVRDGSSGAAAPAVAC